MQKTGLYKTVQREGTHVMEQGRKAQAKSLQENHQEILNNLMSTIIGKPTIVEAQRILKVMEQLLANLETFLYLDSEFVGRFSETNKGKLHKEIVQQLSTDTYHLFTKQAEIEQKYRPYANLEQAIKEGEEIDEQKKLESERLEKQLSENFRNLMRRIQANPADLEIIKQLKNNVNPELNDTVHCIRCMKIIMLKKLSTAAEEEENHTRQLQELKEKISSYDKTKEQCDADLKKLREERTKHTNEKKDEIEKLKSALLEIKSQKQNRQQQLQKETKTKFDQLEKDHKTKEDKLIAELNALSTAFQKLKEENQNEESQLKRRKTASDTLLTEAISIYDNMMEEKIAFKQDLQNECAVIEKQLKDKIEYFKVVDAEREREKKLEQEFKKRQELFEIQQQKRMEAARHIQAFFKLLKKPRGKKKNKKSKK